MRNNRVAATTAHAFLWMAAGAAYGLEIGHGEMLRTGTDFEIREATVLSSLRTPNFQKARDLALSRILEEAVIREDGLYPRAGIASQHCMLFTEELLGSGPLPADFCRTLTDWFMACLTVESGGRLAIHRPFWETVLEQLSPLPASITPEAFLAAPGKLLEPDGVRLTVLDNALFAHGVPCVFSPSDMAELWPHAEVMHRMYGPYLGAYIKLLAGDQPVDPRPSTLGISKLVETVYSDFLNE